MAKEQIEPSVDEQLKALELEERKQALESKKIQDELARIQLTQARQELETKRSNKERGKIDAEKAIADLKSMQSRCNHHVGGEGPLAVTMGQGDLERPTCVSGIQFTNEQLMLRCNRCGKKWRNNIPNGDDFHGPWVEGVQLFRKSQFKTIATVGGIKVSQSAVA